MTAITFPAGAATEIGSPHGYNLSIDVPDGYSYHSRVAPTLLYPVEVAAIANWDIPVNEGDDGAAEAWPRIDLMPKSGVLLWILQGDVGYDYQAMPGQGEWFVPPSYTYLAPEGPSVIPATAAAPAVVGTERALGGPERFASPWTGSNIWARLVPLAGPEGETPEQPPYLMLYQFAGTGEAPTEDVDAMVTSMKVVYG
jgi:hypothetical protein